MAKGRNQPSLFPQTEEIIAILSKESPQDLVVVIVPSHDRKNVELPPSQVGEWADSAMRLMADLYRGATAYQAFKGIFKTDEGHYLVDKPILIESLADIESIQDPEKLNQLVHFAKRMGKTLNQDTVMLIFGTVGYYINDYSGA